MNRAVFLDRDGVINDHRQFVNRPSDLYLYDYVGKAIQKLNQADFFVALVTNQGGVGLGFLTEETLHEIHKKMTDAIMRDGGYFDAISYCPHAPKANCLCRKPKPGMILTLAREHEINLDLSYMVGDRDVDIVAGQRAGCSTVLVGDGTFDNGIEPTVQCKDLSDAVEWILQDAQHRVLS